MPVTKSLFTCVIVTSVTPLFHRHSWNLTLLDDCRRLGEGVIMKAISLDLALEMPPFSVS